MILHDRNDILHIVRDEIDYHYPMQTYTTFLVPAISIQDYIDCQKPSQQYRIENESKISGDYLILDALSEVYHEANEQMLMNEENAKIITEIKEQITDRTKNDFDKKT
jgi:hypothetical protein